MFSAWVSGRGRDPTHQHPPMRPFLKEMQLFLTFSSILPFCSGGAEFQRHGEAFSSLSSEFSRNQSFEWLKSGINSEYLASEGKRELRLQHLWEPQFQGIWASWFPIFLFITFIAKNPTPWSCFLREKPEKCLLDLFVSNKINKKTLCNSLPSEF